MKLINATDALTIQILAREISDRITISVADLGISSVDYFINKMEHHADMGSKRHQCTFSIAKADVEAFWVLGKVGFSELGLTTKLVF